jgi:hypothetical protein
VLFDYLANLRKLKKKCFLKDGWGLLINEKPNQEMGREKCLGTAAIPDHFANDLC